ncbi:porin family protein [Myroides sp. WP-1]|uniref:porin family protein n=1 Tax=Myroides sp. WP-1 TaxID=2759944 RepID=UPI0015F7DAFA|nr:porin family protein [Myroides sp. WP-1]MBB1138224.1 PorT family protein [Myroides sp. WP-1]
MKKITLTLCALFMSLTAVMGQEAGVIKEEKSTSKNQSYFGFKAGYNRTTITNAVDVVGKSGMHIGIMGEYFVADQISLQGEFFYTTMGGDIEPVFPFTTSSGKITMNYLAIPFMLKVYVVEGFNIKAGPQFAFAVKTEGKVDGQTGDIGSVVNKVDFGFTTGIGYDFPSGVFLDTRVYFGAVNVLKNTESNKNFAFNLGAGYKF